MTSIHSLLFNKLVVFSLFYSLILFFCIQTAQAHPLPNTQIILTIKQSGNEIPNPSTPKTENKKISIKGQAIVPSQLVASALKKTNATSEKNAPITKEYESQLKTYFSKHIYVTEVGLSQPTQQSSKLWQVDIDHIYHLSSDDSQYGGHHGVIDFFAVEFSITPPKEGSIDNFILQYDAVIHEVVTHKAFVFQNKQHVTLFNHSGGHNDRSTNSLNKHIITKENYLGKIAYDFDGKKVPALTVLLSTENTTQRPFITSSSKLNAISNGTNKSHKHHTNQDIKNMIWQRFGLVGLMCLIIALAVWLRFKNRKV